MRQQMGKGVFLKLIFYLTVMLYQESRSMDNFISREYYEKLPVLIQMKNFRNKLQKFFIPQLHRLYDLSQKKIDMYKYSPDIINELESLKQQLKNCETIEKLLENNCIFFKTYQYHLLQLLSYQMTNSHHTDHIQKLITRRDIWLKLQGFLNITQKETKELISECKLPEDNNELINSIKASGDFSYMETMDIHFAMHLSRFMDISIDVFEYKLSQKNT